MVDERTNELLRLLEEGQSMLAELGKDQEAQLRNLERLLSDEDQKLLRVFVEAYPQGRLTAAQRKTLEDADADAVASAAAAANQPSP